MTLTSHATARVLQLMRPLIETRAIVTLGKLVEDAEDYAEPGMRARLVGLERRNEDEWYVRVNFSEFADYNAPFETYDFWDARGQPTLSARQAGFYKDEDIYYMDPAHWTDLLTPVPSASSALIALFAAEAEQQALGDMSYTEWLESKLSGFLGLSDVPMPSVSDVDIQSTSVVAVSS